MKTYVFDIDGTICTQTKGGNYHEALPIADRVKKVNELYEAGNTIILLTARGMGMSGNNQVQAYGLLYSFTLSQLEGWGVKFHSLFLGKPEGDIYIDDKGIKDSDFFQSLDRLNGDLN